MVVVKEPGSAPVEEIQVEAPPPPAQQVVVVKPARPNANHAWVPGHHVRRGRRYVWVPGRWTVPPRAGATWVAGRHDRRRGVWVVGRWR